VVDVTASNKDGFPWKPTCVSLFKLNKPICHKLSLLHLENSDLPEINPSKTVSFLTREQCTRRCSFNIDASLWRRRNTLLTLAE
jgi:hypothetical protein